MAKKSIPAKSRANASSRRPARERERTNGTLNESEARWRSLLENVHDFIFLLAPDLTILYINRTLPGLEPDDVVGKSALDYVPPEYHQAVKARMERVLVDGVTDTSEVRGIGPHDGEAWYSVRLGPARLDGNVVAACIASDITERRRAEEALRIRNRIAEIFLAVPDEGMYGEVLQLILDVMESPHGIFGYIDENGALVYPSMTRDIWEQCQVAGKDFVFPREAWGGIWGRAVSEKKSFYSNKPGNVPDGHIPVRRALTVPIIHRGEVIGNLLVGNKATDYEEKDRELLETIAGHIAPVLDARLARQRHDAARERAEQALAESEERWRSVVENAQDIIFLVGRDLKIQYINHTVPGLTPDEVIGTSVFDYIAPEYHDLATKAVRRVFRTGGLETYENRGRGPRGEEAWYSARLGPVRLGGKVLSVAYVTTDITERKRAGEALQESEERLRTLVTNAPVILFAIDREGVFTVAQGRGMSAVALRPEEHVGQSIFEVYRDVPGVIDAARRALSGEAFTTTVELRLSTFEAHVTPVRDARGAITGAIAVATDITERRRAEQETQLLQATIQAMSEAQDFDTALEVALSTICEATGWDFGEAWVPRPDGETLECCPAWYARTEDLEPFRQASEEATVSPGAGLPGRVWLSKAPEWIHDVSIAREDRFLRGRCAADVGLKAALAVPIMAERQMLAVLEFLMSESREEDSRMVDLVSAVAAQLGSIALRKRAEAALRLARDEMQRRIRSRLRRKNPYRLTLREFTILHLVAVGRKDKEIGAELEISPLTVHKHVASVLIKMGAKSRTEASVRALREGLLDEPAHRPAQRPSRVRSRNSAARSQHPGT